MYRYCIGSQENYVFFATIKGKVESYKKLTYFLSYLFRVYWKRCRLSSAAKITASSAKRSTCTLVSFGKLSIKIMKDIGPSTDPCCTLSFILVYVLVLESMETNCCLSVKYDLNQFNSIPFIHLFSRVFSEIWWSQVSIAAAVFLC